MSQKLNRLIITALVLILVSGCNLQQKRTEKCQKWGVCGTDSVIIKDTVEIDTIVLDDSQMWLDMLFECDSAGDILIRHIENLETENTDLKLKLDKGRLVVYVKQPNDTIQVIKPIHSEKIIKTLTLTKRSKWDSFTTWYTIGTWIVILLYIAYRIRKFFTFLNNN